MKALSSLLTLAALVPALVHADGMGVETTSTRTSRRAKKPASPPTPKAPDAKVNQGPFVTGEFLYWIADEEGLEYVVSGVSNTGGSSTAVSQGKAKEPEFDWEPGVRLGLGYTLPTRNWEAGIYWTRFETDARGHKTAPTPIGSDNKMFPILDIPQAAFGVGTLGAPLDSADVKLNLEYNALDFLLAREFRVNDFFSLRPAAGVRTAWISQHYRITYAATTADPTDPLHKIKLDNDFTGVGARVALDSYWECHRLLSLFAKAGMTLFHGTFDIRQVYTNGASGIIYGALHNDELHRVVPEFDAALGLRLQLGPCGVLKRCELSGAYEFVLYPKQNQTLYFMDDTRAGIAQRQRGDLAFQGLTVGATLYF